MKVVDLRRQSSAKFSRMLESEIALLQELRHRNIVALKQVYHTANNCYLVTEYCERGDLAAHLRRHLRLPEIEAVVLLRDLLCGYRYLVRKGVVHRDLKPANSFLSAEGTLKIADFGFAMKVGDAALAKMNVGSPVYMAPEALERSEYSFQSDIFSIGVLYYELLHGYTPWPCRSEEELLRRVRTEPLRFSQNCAVSEASRDFITRCLRVDRAQRMSEADLFGHELLVSCKVLQVVSANLGRAEDSARAADEYQLRPKHAKPMRPRKRKEDPGQLSIADRLKELRARSEALQKSPSPCRKISIQESLRRIVENQQLRKEREAASRAASPTGEPSDDVPTAKVLSLKCSDLEPMVRRLSRQALTERARIKSERLDLGRQLGQRGQLRTTPEGQRRVGELLRQTVEQLGAASGTTYFARLLEKMQYLLSRLDELVGGARREWHVGPRDDDDPYLKCVAAEKDAKEVCKVAEFYCKRLVRMVGHKTLIGEAVAEKRDSEGGQPIGPLQKFSLTTMLRKVQSVMDCIANNQEVAVEEPGRAKRSLHSEYIG